MANIIQVKKQYVFQLFFRDGMPLPLAINDLENNYKVTAKTENDIEHHEWFAFIEQFKSNSLLFETQGRLVSQYRVRSIFFRGFTPTWLQSCKRYLNANVLAVIAIIISFLALLIPFITQQSN
ncbi:MAG: hypothetical protein IPQ11_16525 [Bacteroidetes bacterium]|nr:hypothetical protein [Bacteroidota bacterium]